MTTYTQEQVDALLAEAVDKTAQAVQADKMNEHVHPVFRGILNTMLPIKNPLVIED